MINPLKFLSNFVKNTNQRQLDKIQKIVNLINSLEPKMNKLADEEFPKKTLANNLKTSIFCQLESFFFLQKAHDLINFEL